MTREQLEHAIRAVGSILATHEVLVIGSQALHAVEALDPRIGEIVRGRIRRDSA